MQRGFLGELPSSLIGSFVHESSLMPSKAIESNVKALKQFSQIAVV